MAHTLDVNRLGEVFESLRDAWERLNSWEQDFVESVEPRWKVGRKLSEGTLEKLEEIYQKV